MTKLQEIWSLLEAESRPCGLEVAPFKVGWYNASLADQRFAFNLPPDTLAFVVVSAPSMFEKSFLPFVRELKTADDAVIRDPLDRCMHHHFAKLCGLFPPHYGAEPMHDFEMASPVSKRPKVLVQTAGHVAGVVRFYRHQDLNEEGLKILKSLRGKDSKVFPVCVHPRFGGWFGLRGILLFKNVQIFDDLTPKSPPDVIPSQAEIAKLLYLFNDHWKDWRYRDVGVAHDVERYSPLQQKYFGLPPDLRKELLDEIASINLNESLDL